MTWANLLWLIVGVGCGLALSQGRRSPSPRRSAPVPLAPPPELPPPSPAPESPTADLDTLRSRLADMELAYQMAMQMSQFKGNFLARTSHELRSPLNGLIGMHQLILADLCDSPEEAQEFLAQANDCALKMVRVLDEVIEASKVEQGRVELIVEPVEIATLFADIHTLTHLQAQNRNIRLTIAPPAEAIVGWADFRRLRQALVMLIESAIATVEEGSITLALATAAPPNTVHIWLDTPLPAAQWQSVDLPHLPLPSAPLAKSDRPALVHALQQPFPTPGYVLAVARSLLQTMQGDLTVESSAGEFTRICGTIPTAPPQASID